MQQLLAWRVCRERGRRFDRSVCAGSVGAVMAFALPPGHAPPWIRLARPERLRPKAKRSEGLFWGSRRDIRTENLNFEQELCAAIPVREEVINDCRSLLMRTKAQIKSNPIHPILVSFPIGLWVTSFVFDLLGVVSGNIYLHIA